MFESDIVEFTYLYFILPLYVDFLLLITNLPLFTD